MATFKVVTRGERNDGILSVYIRATHNRKSVYIKTGIRISKSFIKKGQITENHVIGRCAFLIESYYQKLSRENIIDWTVKEVVDFLLNENEKIPFYPFCEKYIGKMINNDQKRNAQSYQTALNSFKKHFGDNIMFQDITSKAVIAWIDTLKDTARAKQLYPVNIKAMFEAGAFEYNDYDKSIFKIPNRPFYKLEIPNADMPEKRAIEVTEIRKLLSAVPDTDRSILAKDVATMILFLVGINTADLYYMEKSNFKNGKLCYNRRKTKNNRADKAYIEVSVRPEILPLFEKYKSDGGRLFDFGYVDEMNFNKNVNIGLKRLCEIAAINPITSYTLRHSWATIAKNDCGADTDLVGLCLNHAPTQKVTDRYIRKIYTPIDDLNNQVLEYIFNPKEGEKKAKPIKEKPKVLKQLSLFS